MNKNGNDKNDVVKNTTQNTRLFLYSDGGSRGNPGPSACGFIIQDENGKVIYEGGEYLGVTTNNQAEYQGVRLALEKAIEIGGRDIVFHADSQLVVNQLTGVYKIKNKDLWPIYERIKELAAEFDRIEFKHILREYNGRADAMVNKILNDHERSESLR
ncbi:MAG: ribonuclease HI family protein [Candidatus Nomurabacteria bacterium]|jgi:ribonuclease HI|nr:ribonuclease HI family protein [Candidatus Nomurabacteria bacterium]